MFRKWQGERVLVTVLTKKMAETLTDYLNDVERMRQLARADEELPAVAYLHSDVETLDRSDILADLRLGKYDVLVGINLLREGLDLPEVSLVAILDADKEGFLRSETSLVQTIGRAARHLSGRAILYADKETGSMARALAETARRREFQLRFNQEHGITPQGVQKEIRQKLLEREEKEVKRDRLGKEISTKVEKKSKAGKKRELLLKLDSKTVIDLNNVDLDEFTPYERKSLVPKVRRKMTAAAKEMDFELAAILRDLAQDLEG